MRHSLLQLTLLLWISCLFLKLPAQYAPFNPWEIELDSLQSWLTLRVENVEDDSISHAFAHISLKRAKEAQDLEAIGEANVLLAEWHNYHFYYFTENDSAIFYDKESIKIYEKLGDKEKLAECYTYLALDAQGLNMLELAEEAAFKATALYEEVDNPLGIANNYRTLAAIYLSLKDPVTALEYGLKMTEIPEVYEKPEYAGLAHDNLARAYALIGEDEEVIIHSTKGLAYFEEAVESEFVMYEYYSCLEARGNAYYNLGQYDKALDDFEYAVSVSREHLGDSLANEFLLNIGKVYRKQERYQEALSEFEKVLAFENKYNKGEARLTLFREIALTYAGLNDYENAFLYDQQADEIDNQGFNQRISSLESELEAKYQSKQKDQMINAQKQEIRQSQTIQWLSIGIALLFALILAGLYYFYQRNQKTSALLAEKAHQNEILLKEIHHRVKNNLQTISSLLGIQSASINDPKIQTAVAQSQHRVESIALIHQKLYQGEDLATVEMSDYLRTLSSSIQDGFWQLQEVKLEFDLDEMELDVDTATPIGLIANELITNSFKYAFPDGKSGSIQVLFKRKDEQNLTFQVKDNGVGLRESPGTPSSGFGSQLVNMLTQQLKGKIQINGSNGVTTQIVFPYSNI